MPTAEALMNNTDIALVYLLFLLIAYAITIDGAMIINNTPMNNGKLGTVDTLAANAPNAIIKPKIIAAAAFARGVVGKPPLSKPAAKNIIPTNITKALIECIPSKKVLAMPARDNPTPAIPIMVKPIPGTSNSQSLNTIYHTF
jgi:hypothetical protein